MTVHPGQTARADGATIETLVQALRRHAAERPETVALTYLGDGEAVKEQLTFAALDLRAQAIAARLQGLGAGGECVLVVQPPGLEFVSAFFGCLYAGVIAVPLPVPRQTASMRQFLGIIADLGPRILLTTATTLSRLERMNASALDELISLPSEETDAAFARAWRAPAVGRDDVAYLQYTSGSTSSRKGVVISHRNVVDNILGISARFRHHVDSVSVNWLPHFHDLGLVSGILQPLFHGHHNVMLSPTAFVQQPLRWLNAISQFRGTYTNSPNYGYDLCVRRATPAHIEQLDLRSLEVALNGAEPVRGQTLQEFAATFAPCGLNAGALYPAYGLAEATLVVSGGEKGALPLVLHLDAAALERNQVVECAASASARAVVGCGSALPDTDIEIVDQATGSTGAAGTIGEIWVRGPGVASGYWQQVEASRETFGATLNNDTTRTYLRTGDLGFLRNGALFVTGRLKDLIIVRGNNHYPQDIEWTCEQVHAAFRPGCGAAFAITQDDEERLVVVFELEREFLRSMSADELGRCARKAIAEEHELRLHELVLLKTGSVPRTSSGKIQRQRCRQAYLADELEVVGRSGADNEAAPSAPTQVATTPSERVVTPGVSKVADLLAWLREYADQRLNSRLMDERRALAPPVILDFGNRGVLGLQVAETFGGLGLGHRDALRVIEQLGAIDQTLAMMTIVHNTLGIGPIRDHAQAALRDALLPQLARGRQLAAFAITEAGAGSNPQAMSAYAQPEGAEHWRLYGNKIWSGNAGWASVVNVFTQNRLRDGTSQGHTGFVVPTATAGLRVGAEAMTLGMRAMVQNEIVLDGAVVASSQLLGGVGTGMAVAQDAMMQGRLHIAAACVGGIKRCLQLFLRYAERRAIATGRLIENPLVLERVGALHSAGTAIAALVAEIAERLDHGQAVALEAYVVCKTAGPEWFWRAADDLVQFLGGRGYIETNLAAQLLRDARVARILEGPTEALSMFLGSRVANEGRSIDQLLRHDLAAPAVSEQLAECARAIIERCDAAQPAPSERAQARRWAHALIGQVATDAVMLAVQHKHSAGADCHWAQHNFTNSCANALTQATHRAWGLETGQLVAAINGYADAIGDTEQSMPGEDHVPDPLLRRATVAVTDPARRETTDRPPTATLGSVVEAPAKALPNPPTERSRQDIERFISEWVAAELKLPVTSIDANRALFDYGVDSVTAVMLSVSLEEWLGIEVYPDVVYDHPGIQALAGFLLGLD